MRARSITFALAVGSVLVAGCTGGPPQATRDDPTQPRQDSAAPHDPMRPLHGDEPTGSTRLRLLAGDTVIDVDANEQHRVTNWPDETMIHPIAVGSDAVLSAICRDCHPPSGELFALRRGATAAERIGSGWIAAPAPDGVWVRRHQTEHVCTLSKIGLTGHTLVADRPFDCNITPAKETSLGLMVWVTGGSSGADSEQQVLDIDSLRPIVRDQRIHAIIGQRILSSDDNGFVLSDQGTQTRIAAPTSIGVPSGLASPDGRYVAIAYEHPAWPGPRQRLDLWLLDLITLEWIHLPAMPLGVALKGTAHAWAPDGRLVILGEFWDVGQRLVYWRPGQGRLTVTRLSTDVRTGSLVVLP